VGSESYNKLLSERRARAVLGVLTQDPEAWETLYKKENWGLKPIQVMLNTVSGTDPMPEDGQDGPLTRAGVKAFQTAHPPLQVDGIAGPQTRKQLFLAYFQKASETPIDAARFFDFGGERMMGCGEYNPFTAPNTADEHSRRVVVIVFDSLDVPKTLPCKIGDIGPCQPNLVGPNGPPPDPKNVHFRCKVFAKFSVKCPGGPPPDDPGLENPDVEPVPTDTITLKLLTLGHDPASKTEATVVAGAARVFGTTDEKGILTVQVPQGTKQVTVTYAPDDAESLTTVTVQLGLPDDDAGALGRLRNLGYPADDDRDFALFSFQRDFELEATVTLDDPTRAKLKEVHGS
jgi:hypothetical protein